MAQTHGIPTVHKGRRHRSRLEARWAAFFDLLGWPYEYEPFDLGGWIPDFILLGKVPVLVEVKPVSEFPRDVADKIERAEPKHDVLILGCSIPVKQVDPVNLDAFCDQPMSSLFMQRAFGWFGIQPGTTHKNLKGFRHIPVVSRQARVLLNLCRAGGLEFFSHGSRISCSIPLDSYSPTQCEIMLKHQDEFLKLVPDQSPPDDVWAPGWLKALSLEAWRRETAGAISPMTEGFVWSDAILGRFNPGDHLGFFHVMDDLISECTDRISGIHSSGDRNVCRDLPESRFLLPWAEAGNLTQWRRPVDP